MKNYLDLLRPDYPMPERIKTGEGWGATYSHRCATLGRYACWELLFVFKTRTEALQALRHRKAEEFAAELARIDAMIEREGGK